MAQRVDQQDGLASNESAATLIRSGTIDEDMEEPVASCGMGSCRPSWMQSCANIKLFTIVLCLLACINGSISASYLPSVITTIERRFEFDSSITGLVVGSYEIGATIAVIFVSYLGNRRNIPTIIGLGTILVGTGTCLFALPHFLASPYSLLLNEEANRTSEDTCLKILSHSATPQETQPEYCKAAKLRAGNELYVILFVTAQSLIGIGSTPILTIGLSYIDNHVPKKKSPQYLAFVYASATLGPVLGFGCGAALMEVYVDFLSPSVMKLPLTSADSRWVGAWWVGFLIFGVLTSVMAPPFFAFPKALPDPKTLYKTQLEYVGDPDDISISLDRKTSYDESGFTDKSAKTSEETKWTSIKEFPQALMKLVRNPVYMLVNLATVFEMVIVTGFVTFTPKYLETQFGLKTSEANLYTGSLAVPGAALGILSSGLVLRKLKLTLRGALQLTIILSVLGLASFSLAFVFGCDNTKIAGITVPYQRSIEPIEKAILFPQNLTNACNSDCSCIDYIYSPVCGHNSITYFSACHAGCRITSNGTAEKCGCVGYVSSLVNNPQTSAAPHPLAGQVTAGACKKDCHMVIPFMMVLLAISILVAGLKTPIAMLTMRCVEEDLRSFGLGIQMVIIRTCALLPAPIIFGTVIDTTCLWWKFECNERKNCLIYDVESFRYKLPGICAALHLMGLLTFVTTWYIVRKQEKQRAAQTSSRNLSVQSDPRFYINKEGERSIVSLAPTDSTAVTLLESSSTSPCEG